MGVVILSVACSALLRIFAYFEAEGMRITFFSEQNMAAKITLKLLINIIYFYFMISL